MVQDVLERSKSLVIWGIIVFALLFILPVLARIGSLVPR